MEEVQGIEHKGGLLSNNKDIADVLSSYFVESYTRAKFINWPEGIFSSHNVLADFKIGDIKVLDECIDKRCKTGSFS